MLLDFVVVIVGVVVGVGVFLLLFLFTIGFAFVFLLIFRITVVLGASKRPLPIEWALRVVEIPLGPRNISARTGTGRAGRAFCVPVLLWAYISITGPRAHRTHGIILRTRLSRTAGARHGRRARCDMKSTRDVQPRLVILLPAPSMMHDCLLLFFFFLLLALRVLLSDLTRRLVREAQELLRQLLARGLERVRPRTAIAAQRRPDHGRRREIRRHQLLLESLHRGRLDGSLVVIAVFFRRRGRKAHVSSHARRDDVRELGQRAAKREDRRSFPAAAAAALGAMTGSSRR